MPQLKGFRAYSVDSDWKDLLPFDGDLKLQHKFPDHTDFDSHFFEVISRENDILLTASIEDQIHQLKQKVLINGRKELCKLISKGAYNSQPEQVVYVYTIEFSGQRMLGILGDLDHQAYDNGDIYPHEETLANKIDIIASITKNAGVFNGFPIVFAKFEDHLRQTLQNIASTTFPLICIDMDAVRHTVFKTTLHQTSQILDLVSKIPEAFIADGHHRFKGFSKFIKSLTEEERQKHTSDFTSFPVYLVSEDSLQIKKFHRVLDNLHGKTEDQVLSDLSKEFVVSHIDVSDLDSSRQDYYELVDARVNPRAYGRFSFYFHESRRWVSAVQKTIVKGNAVESLDLQYLTDHFFRDIMAIPNLSKSSSVFYYPSIIGGSRFLASLPHAKLSILCNELSIEEVKDVARNGLRMPPKATLFYPKPLLGMLFKMHIRLDCGC